MQTLAAGCALALGLFLSATTPAFAINYAGGTYTNLCGSGTAANSHSCNGGCNTSTGSCSSSGNNVVKFVCDGRRTECTSNESGFSTNHSVSGVGCGKTVQIDVFNKTCRVNGNWVCGNNDGSLKDYIVWYSGDCSTTVQPTPTPPGDSCQNWLPVNMQFRKAGSGGWISGAQTTQLNLKQNEKIDANCFAKNGGALLKDAYTDIRRPDGATQRINSAEVRNYNITQNGVYTFSCSSSTLASCGDNDSFVISDLQTSTCNELAVLSGNDSVVPGTIRFRATGADNKGSIQRYRWFFGDGQQVEGTTQEIDHRYEISGNFLAKVEVKDSVGNWKSSSLCEASVRIKPSNVESHRSGCSDLFILEGNDTEAPTTAKFRVTGFDNKTGIQQYKVDFGNGVVKEQSGEHFEQRYEQPGTFTIKGYIKDSQGNWKGGDSSCQRTLYVKTKPLTTQPKTGTPTNITVLAVTSGFIGLVMLMRKLQLAKVRAR
jgi:hypothetical protein